MIFPVPVVTKRHKLSGCKQPRGITLPFWNQMSEMKLMGLKSKCQSVKMSVRLVPSGGPRGESSSFLLQLLEAPAFLGSWPLLCLQASSTVSSVSHSDPLIRTLVMTLGPPG